MYPADRRRGACNVGEESRLTVPGVAGDRRTCARVCPWLASGKARAGHGVSVFVATVALSGGALYFLARFSREPEPHLVARDRACFVNNGVRGRRRARANWFALGDCVYSRRNYFAYGCGCSDRYHGSSARAAKNRHHFGWRESRQRRDGARRLPLRHCGDDERKVFIFRSKRALCFSCAGRHRYRVGCRLARFPTSAPSRRSARSNHNFAPHAVCRLHSCGALACLRRTGSGRLRAVSRLAWAAIAHLSDAAQLIRCFGR